MHSGGPRLALGSKYRGVRGVTSLKLHYLEGLSQAPATPSCGSLWRAKLSNTQSSIKPQNFQTPNRATVSSFLQKKRTLVAERPSN